MNPFAYDLQPSLAVPGSEGSCVTGWDAIADRLAVALAGRRRAAGGPRVLVVETYPGIEVEAVERALVGRLRPARVLRAAEAMWPPDRIDALVAPFLGGDDPVFGFMNGLQLPDFFDPERLALSRDAMRRAGSGIILAIGVGASWLAGGAGDLLVYADLSRWEAQRRFRRDAASNLGVENRTAPASLQYKRAFFVDWRVADRWKRPLLAGWDYVLDTHDPAVPKLADGEAVRAGLRWAVTRPFRVVPYFDAAPWGGQWMRERFGLDPAAPNYGWGFDGVPEENSLYLDLGGTRIEIPALDLVFHQPRALLGEAVHARFGDEFPIRFDFLDTLGGGPLSLQVHPLTEYIQRHFGMHYTQDESYYLLEAGPEAGVYLGLREDVDAAAMVRDLRVAREGRAPFPAHRHVQFWPARRHDHFLIPAGTVHASGAHAVVLEISATPYLFTFKMWDWERLGLDGRPRPIHLDHALANIDWTRTAGWVGRHLVNAVTPVRAGPGWREERTGLHEREFIETRRHWFTVPVPHHTRGGVHVLNLVQGEAAWVESQDHAFEPFLVRFAETFIVPAAVGPYRIRPFAPNPSRDLATLLASVRTGL
ncbi:MAG: class I mannose-6-phosphate isomerase [Verrucomicrobiae bacterium]|nr:class I mannose-6-phosphate isomerase [Verrucomicrobiae bacterium]